MVKENKMRKIRILIVDDHTVVREGLHQMLGKEPDMEVVGEATDGSEAVRRRCGVSARTWLSWTSPCPT